LKDRGLLLQILFEISKRRDPTGAMFFGTMAQVSTMTDEILEGTIISLLDGIAWRRSA